MENHPSHKPNRIFLALIVAVFVLMLVTLFVVSPTSAAKKGYDAYMAKSQAASATVNVGDEITYTYEVANDGPELAEDILGEIKTSPNENFLRVSSTQGSCVPESSTGEGVERIACDLGDIPVGGSVEVTLVTEAVQASTMNNFFTIENKDQKNANNKAKVQITIEDDGDTGAQADLSVELTGPPTATAIGLIEYEIGAFNAGPSTADVEVTIPANADLTFNQVTRSSDPNFVCDEDSAIPSQVNCVYTSMAPGASATAGIWYDLGNVGAGTTIDQTATITSNLTDPNPADNTYTWRVVATNDATADVSVVKRGPDTAVSEGEVSYTIVVTNDGPSTASITLTDTLNFGICGDGGAGSVECVNSDHPSADCSASGPTTGVICELELLAGETATQTVSSTLERLSSGTRVPTTATATVNGTITDPDLSNNTANHELVIVDATSEADLAIQKSGPNDATAGATVEFALILPALATGSTPTSVTVTDELNDPAFTNLVSITPSQGSCEENVASSGFTCNMGIMEEGDSASITYEVELDAGLAPGTTITNTANISGSAGVADPDRSNNSDTIEMTVIGETSSLFTLEKTGPATATAGSTYTYTVRAGNISATAQDATITDPINDPNLTFVAARSADSAVDCSASGSTGANCSITGLAPGATAEISVEVQVAATAQSGDTISNEASLTDTDEDGLSNGWELTVN